MSVEPLLRTRAESGDDGAHGSLIGYLPVGFPDFDASVDAVVAMAEHGVDVIELGVPYSDPVMDGPVIQAATGAALERGFRVSDVFRAIEAIRRRVDVPVLVMSYWNLVLQHGVEEYARDLQQAGGAGLITPDLVPDEGADWITAAEAHDLDHVFLAAPTSSDERLRLISDTSRGFVYVVSTMGVTGTRTEVDERAGKLTARLRAFTDRPLAVGLGISRPDQVADVLGYADGAIVGSAFVRALRDGGASAVATLAEQLAAGKTSRATA
ncbi:tryptophan synthase subunit alpha [Pseudoclavibacter sp. CFCC 13611]|uniref:tryptophan synthase subunit alpha n=1 Tax=Pseudoclavibacter sp. CFCC 13611 TaxID=2615178 RepID=UPI00130148E1|nr:tryptophan synthase subunit alpha [Pseudoclavibacter sp. CFCC 13611]KAB1663448.1 tryptophan synthase subunit alpha [Pseudoclavibacter sp. CFCC 13611]